MVNMCLFEDVLPHLFTEDAWFVSRSSINAVNAVEYQCVYVRVWTIRHTAVKHLRYMEAYPHEVFHQNCKSFRMNPLSLIYQLKLMIVSGYLKTLHLNQYVDVYFQIQHPWPHFQTPNLKTHSGNDLKLYIDGRLLWISKINNLISQLALSKVIENTWRLFISNFDSY